MDIISKLINSFGFGKKDVTGVPLSDGVSGNDPFSIWLSSKKISAEKAMSIFNGWVYACVRAISESVAQVELELYKIKKGGKNDAEYEEIDEHEVLDLLHSANPHQTGYELMYTTAAHLELTGNAYWLLDGVSNDKSKPTAIYTLNPKYVKVIKAPLPEFITGYEYEVNGKKSIYKPYEIIHLKYPDPNDAYEGIGTVQAIAQWIDAENYSTEVNRQYFVNGARLSGLLKVKQALDSNMLDYLRKSFERVYKGSENAYKVGILPQDTEYQELGNTPKDMDFANLQITLRDKILAGFRVPKTILGAAESETNRATAETAAYVFAERTVKPKIKMIVRQLNEKLLPRFGSDLVLDFEDPTPENKEQEIAEMQAALGQGQAAISVNEARDKYLGLGPIENGDAVLTNFSLQPLGEPVKKAQPARLGSKKLKAYGPRISKTKQEMSSTIAKRLVESVKETTEKLSALKNKDISTVSDDEYELVHKALLTRVTPKEKEMMAAVKKVNDDQVKEVLKNLPNEVKDYNGKTKALEDLFDAEKWITIMADLITPISIDVFKQEAAAAAKLIGIELDNPLTPESRRALEHGIGLMARRYNETTRDQLKSRLEDGINQGLGLDDLKERVMEVYDFSNEVRAEMVARTETFRTANAATRDTWKQSGIVKSLKWYTAADERTCEFCGPMHGKVIGIDETFFNLGDTVDGSEGGTLPVDYDTIENPPLHVQCRCYVRPEKITLREMNPAETKDVETLDEKELDELDNIIKAYE